MLRLQFKNVCRTSCTRCAVGANARSVEGCLREISTVCPTVTFHSACQPKNCACGLQIVCAVFVSVANSQPAPPALPGRKYCKIIANAPVHSTTHYNNNVLPGCTALPPPPPELQTYLAKTFDDTFQCEKHFLCAPNFFVKV